MADLASFIRNVPDFPEPGIIYRDISPLLADRDAFGHAIAGLSAPFEGDGVDAVVGIEARGFLFGPSVAQLLGVGFVPVRKQGKLPGSTIRHSYDLEYGTDALEVHADALAAGHRVLVVDDVLATGGTAAATAELVSRLGAHVAGFAFLIELTGLDGRALLSDHSVEALIAF